MFPGRGRHSQQQNYYPQQPQYGYAQPPPQPQYGYGYNNGYAPPIQGGVQGGQLYMGQTSAYQGQGGIVYQRPNGAPPMPHHGRYQQGGHKKALLVGINYIGSKNALRGCINDVHNTYNFLLRNGYRAEDIVILTDDQREMVKVPLKQNILRAMQWLVSGAQPGDCLFFHFSGHGGQEKDQSGGIHGGDEADGMDDCIYPVDFKRTGSIIDDVMHDIMVKPLMKGVRLTCIFDSCHSGSALDLPFVYRAQDGGIKEYNLWKESSGDALNILKGYAFNDVGMMMSSAAGIFKKFQAGASYNKNETVAKKQSPADVIMFSGCKDSQTSADANEAGRFTGALSWAFLTVLNQNPTQSYLTLLQNIRAVLATKYTQKPQLSSSHQIDPNTRFVF